MRPSSPAEGLGNPQVSNVLKSQVVLTSAWRDGPVGYRRRYCDFVVAAGREGLLDPNSQSKCQGSIALLMRLLPGSCLKPREVR